MFSEQALQARSDRRHQRLTSWRQGLPSVQFLDKFAGNHCVSESWGMPSVQGTLQLMDTMGQGNDPSNFSGGQGFPRVAGIKRPCPVGINFPVSEGLGPSMCPPYLGASVPSPGLTTNLLSAILTQAVGLPPKLEPPHNHLSLPAVPSLPVVNGIHPATAQLISSLSGSSVMDPVGAHALYSGTAMQQEGRPHWNPPMSLARRLHGGSTVSTKPDIPVPPPSSAFLPVIANQAHLQHGVGALCSVGAPLPPVLLKQEAMQVGDVAVGTVPVHRVLASNVLDSVGSGLPPEMQARLRKKIKIIQPISETWEAEALQQVNNKLSNPHSALPLNTTDIPKVDGTAVEDLWSMEPCHGPSTEDRGPGQLTPRLPSPPPMPTSGPRNDPAAGNTSAARPGGVGALLETLETLNQQPSTSPVVVADGGQDLQASSPVVPVTSCPPGQGSVLTGSDPRLLKQVHGQLSLLYQWYVGSRAAYLDQARQLLRFIEGERERAEPAEPNLGTVDTVAIASAFDKAIQIMQASSSVELKWMPEGLEVGGGLFQACGAQAATMEV